MDPKNLEETLASVVDGIRVTLRTELTSIWLPIQLGAIALAAAVAFGIAASVRKRFDLVSATMGWPPYLRLIVRAVADNFGVIVFIVVLWIVQAAFQAAGEHARIYLIGVASNLATAWLAIALIASVIRNPFVNRVVAISAWTLAALSILGLLDAVIAALDSRAIVIGGLRVTVLLVLKATAFFLIALWAAAAASNFLERQLRSVPDLTPSIQVLLGKLIRIALLTFAVFIVLGSVGIDLSVLAFFTGAVGVGLGFGLQKIVSNLVSGIILLADKSIKPGDVVSVGDQLGWVTTMGARYTAVDTRDGREYLIPNEDFITQHVVNWSYTNYKMMLEAKFGVSYDSDPHRVRAIAAAAAAAVPRVLTDPPPVCYFVAFGESSLDFSLRFWIGDPDEGVINVRAPVMLALWDAFKREGIEIPYPVRDLRFSGATRVTIERPA